MGAKYNLKYEIYFTDRLPIRDKEIKIDKCDSELHAKTRLDDYLQRKYPTFKSLVVLSCNKDMDISDIFGDKNGFSDMFGGNGFSDMFGDGFGKK